MIGLRVARNKTIGGVVAAVAVVGMVAGVRSLESQNSSTSAPAGASTTVGGASSAASAPSSASITTVTDPTTTMVTTTAPTTTAAPVTTAPPATSVTSVTPAFSCASPGSAAASAPVVTAVFNPQPQQYAPSGDFQIHGTNLSNVSMELLCPAGSTAGPPIVISQGPFSYDGTEVNLHVTGGLVSGGIYDVRVVANGEISALNSGDRLFVAIAVGGSASA